MLKPGNKQKQPVITPRRIPPASPCEYHYPFGDVYMSYPYFLKKLGERTTYNELRKSWLKS